MTDLALVFDVPFWIPPPSFSRRDPTESSIGCFLAGDVRANEQVRKKKNVCCST